MDQLIERKQLNFEIEDAFINTSKAATSIISYTQTERGSAPIDLYESFHASFYYLVILTSDLNQMTKNEKEVQQALAWLENPIGKGRDDKIVLKASAEGIVAFRAYKKVLSSQGVVSLPSK